jgi:hypothetical protein
MGEGGTWLSKGDALFVDAPIAAFPVTWQDNGTAVFTLAIAILLLGLGAVARGSVATSVDRPGRMRP